MWGVLPAYGLYARHARGLTLSNVRFDLASPDLRPAVVGDDLEDLEIAGLRAAAGPQAESLLRLRQTRAAFIHGCKPLGEIAAFLAIEGADTRDIALEANHCQRAHQLFNTNQQMPLRSSSCTTDQLIRLWHEESKRGDPRSPWPELTNSS